MSRNMHLSRRGQAHIGDLSLGIAATSPDPDDPAARINIVDRGSGSAKLVVVRPSDNVRIGKHVLRSADVVPGSGDGYVVFTISSTGPYGTNSPTPAADEGTDSPS